MISERKTKIKGAFMVKIRSLIRVLKRKKMEEGESVWRRKRKEKRERDESVKLWEMGDLITNQWECKVGWIT